MWWGYELINPLEHVVIGISAEGVYAFNYHELYGFIKLITLPQTRQLFLIFTFHLTYIEFVRFPSPGLGNINILKSKTQTLT
jgi:hypothetical protein